MNNQIKITINTDNDAFQDNNLTSEVNRILNEAMNRIDLDGFMATGESVKLRDINGNAVGSITATKEVN